jgi:hypothetical protein
MRDRVALRGFLLLVLGVFVGCDSPSDQVDSEGATIETSTTGLHVTVRVSSDEVSTSEMFQVELMARHWESIKVQFPDVGEKWGDFFVFESRTSPASLAGDGMVVAGRIYTLEPDLPGECFLSGLWVKGVDGDGEVVELTTDPIASRVTSVLAPGETKIRDIAPNARVEQPAKLARWPVALLIANVFLVLCLIVVWSRWKRVKARADDGAVNNFVGLKKADVPEVMKRLEQVVCRVLAQRHQLKLAKVDFAGLVEQFQQDGIEVVGLTQAVTAYDRLQYSSVAPDEKQVRGLYTQFEILCQEVTS